MLTPGFFLALIASLAALALSPLAASDESGSGTIFCIVAVPRFHAPCDAGLKGADSPVLETAQVVSATLRIDWTPRSQAAGELVLFLVGNTACLDEPGASEHCAFDQASGPSPLMVTLTGTAASNVELKGIVELAPICQDDVPPFDEFPLFFVPSGCELPPAKLVSDQPFTYAWDVATS